MVRKQFECLVFQNVIHYPYYTNRERTVEGETVTIHKVGHNSSHEFWLGLTPDDRLICMSIGETNGVISEYVRVFPKGEYPSYLGHW